MKKEYDFSKGERGKFYREDIKMKFPVYLSEELQEQLLKIAGNKNTAINTLVNDLLKYNLNISRTLGN